MKYQSPPSRWRPQIRLARFGAAAAVAVFIFGLSVPAVAIEVPTAAATVSSPTSAQFQFRGGMTATLTATQNTNQYGAAGFGFVPTTPHSSYNASAGMFNPTLDPTTVPTVGFLASAGQCGNIDFTGHCAGNGTVTITFSQPVTDPILDISGLGGNGSCASRPGSPGPPLEPPITSPTNQCHAAYAAAVAAGQNPKPDAQGAYWFGSFLSQQFDIASASSPSGPASVSFANESAGATNLSVTPSTLKVNNVYGDSRCDQSGQSQANPVAPGIDDDALLFGTQAPAGCGSVVLQGTFSSVTFNVSTNVQRMAAANGWTNGLNFANSNTTTGNGAVETIDLARVSLRLSEDMGDAPASYDAGQAAAHIIGPLHLGTGITADAQNTANPTAPPNAGPANLDTDDAINDGVTSYTALQGQPYSLTVPISGTVQPGEVAGWIDFNQDGIFKANERAFADFAAGATSVTLTWPNITLPDPSQPTYMRLRTAFDASQVALPTGVADSGEVEDYLLPVGAIQLIKSINGDDADTAPGVTVADGSTMNITYDVTNTGSVALDNVSISDVVNSPAGAPPITGISPASVATLAPGATTQFTATYPAPAPGVQHTDTGTAVGTPEGQNPDETPGTVTDSNPANAVDVVTSTPTPTDTTTTPTPTDTTTTPTPTDTTTTTTPTTTQTTTTPTDTTATSTSSPPPSVTTTQATSSQGPTVAPTATSTSSPAPSVTTTQATSPQGSTAPPYTPPPDGSGGTLAYTGSNAVGIGKIGLATLLAGLLLLLVSRRRKPGGAHQ